MNQLPLLIAILICTSAAAQIETTRDTDCSLIWEYTDWARDIGDHNNLFPFDYGNDGTLELITNGRYLGDDNSYSWSVIKYDPVRQSYEHVYISKRYEEEIRKMLLQDINQDAIPELLLNEGENLHIIDINSHTTLATVEITNPFSLFYDTYIRFGDVDNDGENEIAVGGHQALNIINATTFLVERVISMDAQRFDVGNVDSDPAIEMAFYSGQVLEITGTNIVTEYHFHSGTSNSDGLLELGDIDNDQKEEVIITLAWDSLLVYDLESESLKYGKSTDGYVTALTVTDIENDNSKELIYSTDSWGDIYCIRASNGTPRWNIQNQGYGTLAVAVADIDQDNTKELIWTNVGFDSPSFFVYNAVTRQHEWNNNSTHYPFFAIDVANIDNDPDKEIVATANKYEGLWVFDAETKKIEYESGPDWDSDADKGRYNILLTDYGDDGDMDIIIGTDDNNRGVIRILDGDTRQVEVNHVFSGNILAIYDLAYADLFGNAVKEFVVLAPDKLLLINSQTFQEINYELVPGSPLKSHHDLLVGNADADPAPEIVVSYDFIYLFDDATFVKKQSALNIYLSAMLFDWDSDGVAEIIATTETGEVHVLETSQLTVLQVLKFEQGPISGLDTIDLNQDGFDEFIAIADGRILFFDQSGQYVYSQFFTSELGRHDGLVVTDYNEDGIDELILGTERGIIQLNLSCASCLWFEVDVTYADPKCGEDNGEIILTSTDPLVEYFLDDENIESPVEGLEDGLYHVLAQNQNGCRIESDVRLRQRDLHVDLGVKNRTCSGENDGLAYLDVIDGSPPFIVEWSNGETTDTIFNLATGTYTLTLSDSVGCVFFDSVKVYQDTMLSNSGINKPACRGVNDGKASVVAWFGESPFQYYWDGIPGGPVHDSLAAGTHTVVVVDANGCSNTHLIEIPETFVDINIELLLADCNLNGAGAAIVNILSGNSPYQYTWSNNSTANALVNVSVGTYTVIVRDAKKCLAYDTIFIPSSILEVESFQNELICPDDTNGMASINIIEGVPPYSFLWPDGSTGAEINNLTAGSHLVTITDNSGCQVIKNIVIEAPDPILVKMMITNDDDATPESDGIIVVTPSGGTPPYQFIWSNGDTGNVADSLSDGIYTLTIIDVNDCRSDTLIELPFFPSPFCLVEGIIFTRQSQVDSFPILYPDCHIIEGNVEITGPDIYSLGSLEQVHHINGDLKIKFTTDLLTLTGLDSLRDIDGKFEIDSNLILQNIFGLGSLSKILGTFTIQDNNNLYSLTGLTMDSMFNDVQIYNNENLRNLLGFDVIRNISGTLRIYGNDFLDDLSGLSALEYADGLWIGNQPFLLTLEGLSSLTGIGEHGLVLSDNSRLTDFLGLESLVKISGQFYITNNILLSSFHGLYNLDSVDYFVVTYSDGFEDMSGLESLRYVRDAINVGNSHGFKNFTGLESVSLGDGSIIVEHNSNLESLAGLENIMHLGESIRLDGNATLTDIQALENIDYTTIETIDLSDMPLLSECAIKSICDYLANGGEYADFTGNATGCNSENQVRNACITDIEIPQEESILIYPNPVHDKLEINGIDPENALISVTDCTGRIGIELERTGNLIFVNKLPPGIYFLRIQSEEVNAVRKFVKL